MTQSEAFLYSEPKRLPPLNLILFLVFGLLFTALVSFLYGVFIGVSPLVYLNVFVTVIFGLTLAYGIKIMAKLFKVFKKKVVITSALVFGFLGVYLSWVAYLLFMVDLSTCAHHYFLEPYLTVQPQVVFEIMADINRYGLWTIGQMPVNGWLLASIWIIEAAIVIVVPYLILRSASFSPFSEQLNQWYVKFVLNKDFESIVMQSQMTEDLKQNPLRTIDNLNNGLANRYSRISVFFLSDEDQQYLLVENVSSDRSGNNKKSYSVAEHFAISSTVAQALIEKYHAQKAFYLEY